MGKRRARLTVRRCWTEQERFPDLNPERKERMTTLSKGIRLFLEKDALCEPALYTVNGISFIYCKTLDRLKSANNAFADFNLKQSLNYFDFFVVLAAEALDALDVSAFLAAGFFAGAGLDFADLASVLGFALLAGADLAAVDFVTVVFFYPLGILFGIFYPIYYYTFLKAMRPLVR